MSSESPRPKKRKIMPEPLTGFDEADDVKGKHGVTSTSKAGCGQTVAPLIPLIIGMGILLVLAVIYRQQQAFATIATQTTGTIVDLAESSSDGDTMYAAVITFTTRNGQAITYTSTLSSSSPPTVGSSIEVLYNPEKPQEAIAAHENSIFTHPVALGFGFFGLLFCVIGLATSIQMLRGKPAA